MVEQQVRDRKSPEALCVTTYSNPSKNDKPASVDIQPSPIGPDEVVELARWMDGWQRVRSAIVDGVHLVDVETLGAPGAARIIDQQYRTLAKIAATLP